MGEGEQAYCHTLYGLGDGSSLAFFQFYDDDFARRHAPPPPDCPFRHIALLVDEQTQQAISERAQCAGVEPTFVDHGYCKSLYLTDPNGLGLSSPSTIPKSTRSTPAGESRRTEIFSGGSKVTAPTTTIGAPFD
jgi:catechol-2,3-dioxygenase